jgi:hypothetical protein
MLLLPPLLLTPLSSFVSVSNNQGQTDTRMPFAVIDTYRQADMIGFKFSFSVMK